MFSSDDYTTCKAVDGSLVLYKMCIQYRKLGVGKIKDTVLKLATLNY